MITRSLYVFLLVEASHSIRGFRRFSRIVRFFLLVRRHFFPFPYLILLSYITTRYS